MQKTLHVQAAMPDSKFANLYFTDNAVTLRVLEAIHSENDFYIKVIQRAQENVGFNPKSEQAGSPPSEDDIKKELQRLIGQARATALPPLSLTKDASNLVNKYVLIDKTLYRIASQKTLNVPSHFWLPYNEVCMVLHRNIGQSPTIPALMFVERNELTRRSHEGYREFHKRIRQSGGYIPFRWIVLPNTTLLSAPLVASPIHNFISNLKLGEPLLKATRGQADKKQTQQADKAVKEFFNYWIPFLKIEGPSTIKANGTAEFTLKTFHQGGNVCKDAHEYFIEPVSGFAPQKQILTENGIGKFRMIALGLRKGETMRFKINDWNWSGKAEMSLKVV